MNPASEDVTADWLVFQITDTGIGMSKAAKSRLFQPFTQADDSTTRKYGGTGLGLALSQRFARMMGGDVTVRSEEGAGSTFTVRVPRHVASASVSEQPPASEEPTASKRSVAPVLVVEDDVDARTLLRRALESGGFEVNEARDGHEALAALAEHGASLLVLDLEMPVMSGYELLDEMSGQPELACIPVVVVTGTRPGRAALEKLEEQAIELLYKGQWSPDDLLRAAERILRRAEVRCVEIAMREEQRP